MAAAARRKTGRPSSYSETIAKRICDRLAAGESLRLICRDETMPHEATVYRWLMNDVRGFRERYARAREAQADALVEEIQEIADDARNDWMEADDGAVLLNKEHVQRSKLRIDTRKWLMSKLAPKKYGEKLDLSVSGEVAVRQITDEQLDARLSALLAKAGLGGGDGG